MQRGNFVAKKCSKQRTRTNERTTDTRLTHAAGLASPLRSDGVLFDESLSRGAPRVRVSFLVSSKLSTFVGFGYISKREFEWCVVCLSSSRECC